MRDSTSTEDGLASCNPGRTDDEPPHGGPDLQSILDALRDRECRVLVVELSEPRAASELSDRCEIPLTTVYRKLVALSEASLVAEQYHVCESGNRVTRYSLAFESIRLRLGDERELDVTVDPK